MRCFICGISGKMGQQLLSVHDDEIHIVGGLTEKGIVNADLAPITTLPDSDVIIDFSHKSALNKVLEIALQHKTPLLIATTGFDKADEDKIRIASEKIPILKLSNTSEGIAVLTKLAELAARSLPNWDCAIIEKHHRSKKDSPSGTALSVGTVISLQNKSLPDIHSIRGGTIPGEHEIIFSGSDEALIITHIAYNRKIFALGALNAAKKLIDLSPGLYLSI